ncbi:MAG: fluoride efflux transporter CrcB [Phycisphaerales bacterium]|nr:MAG: fluoride efflux transporter CrcB [Phycisphaerales bacterium]
MTPTLFILAAFAGGAGAIARYLVDFAVSQRLRTVLPLGTWAVNLSGSLFLGIIVGYASQTDLPPALTLTLGGGFLGAYTTFSTWMYEAVRLCEERAWRLATLHVLGSLIAGVAAAAGGVGIGIVLGGGV